MLLQKKLSQLYGALFKNSSVEIGSGEFGAFKRFVDPFPPTSSILTTP